MEKKDIINFFDSLADSWDQGQVIKNAIIEKILANGGVEPQKDILDIACGTGVLFPFYFEKAVKSVTGIDISPEMVKIAKQKFPETEIICGDAEEYRFDKKFDVIMIHNAFPHFPNPEKLVENLAGYLKEKGRLSIAHSMSRAQLQKHHSGSASKISRELPSPEDLVVLLEPYFNVDITISDDKMYQISGVKR